MTIDCIGWTKEDFCLLYGITIHKKEKEDFSIFFSETIVFYPF